MTASGESRAGRGPAVPSASATVAHQPLAGGGARLSGGLLHAWQQRNAAASLPLALRQLETAGNLANVRLAVAGAREGYRGPVFMDSDIYKVLEAIGWELGRSPDEGLASFLAETTALLEKAQQPDGYLNSYIQVSGRPRYSFLASSHELYCAGHLIQAGIACQRGAGDPALLAVARRFADHLVEHFLGQQEGIDGHPIVETALAELYRETGHEPYLRLASQFIEQRGHGLIGDSGFGSRYLQDHEPVRDTVTQVGHVVRALYLDAGVADVAAETGDAALLQSSLTRWADMVAAKTYLTGGNGSRHEGESFGDRFELPPDRAYNETCAAIASFQWAWRLLLATGDAAYADLMERILYNGFASSTATGGTRFFYVNPLQRRADHFEKDDPGRRREWFNCACCPPNIMRTMASLQHYLATVSRRHPVRAAVHRRHAQRPAGRRGPGRRDGHGLPVVRRGRAAGDRRPAARLRAGRARAGLVRGTGNSPQRRPRRGRMPNTGTWWSGANGAQATCSASNWTPHARLTYPDRRVDAVRGTAAIERGPLVYCLEQADQPAGIDLADLALVPGQLEEPAPPSPAWATPSSSGPARFTGPRRSRPACPTTPRPRAQASGNRVVSRSRPPPSPTSSGTTGTAAPCRSGSPRPPPARSPEPQQTHPDPSGRQ